MALLFKKKDTIDNLIVHTAAVLTVFYYKTSSNILNYLNKKTKSYKYTTTDLNIVSLFK